MKYFKYLFSKSTKELYDVFKEVQGLHGYARAKYGEEKVEDVLDASYEHIIKNFDPSKGELRNYAMKVVGTIHLGINKKESASDEQTKITLDIKTAQDYINSPMEDVLESSSKSDSVDRCINDMVSFFLCNI